MPTRNEEQLVDMIGWGWLLCVVLALVCGGRVLSAAIATLGVVGAFAYVAYKYWRHPEAFRRKES